MSATVALQSAAPPQNGSPVFSHLNHLVETMNPPSTPDQGPSQPRRAQQSPGQPRQRQNNKRKRENNTPKTPVPELYPEKPLLGLDISEYQHNPQQWSWIPPETTYTGTLEQRLTQEIIDFVRFMEPTTEEIDGRMRVVRKYEDLVKFKNQWATLEIFGSMASGLLLPTSDLDLVLVDPKGSETPSKTEMQNGLRPLRKMIRKCATNVNFILHARIPILQFRDQQTGYPMDISYNQRGGCDAVPTVRRLLEELPALRPLVLVLKQFLHVRNLNSGSNASVGGYALVCWVAGFLRIHPDIFPTRYIPAENGKGKQEATSTQQTAALGALLLDFLLLFGFSWDYEQFSLAPGSRAQTWIMEKSVWKKGKAENKLSIQDPAPGQEDWDVASGVQKTKQVAAQLAAAYDALLLTEPGESLLGRILNVDGNVIQNRPLFKRWMEEGPGAGKRARID